ncbi:MAG: VPLPA-CTERM sorting domain-containing protein [Geobacteraceae bacterium]|nr:VPLPA-CTERM sorting domain-containing protein [Geobacteraceae bacterium]
MKLIAFGIVAVLFTLGLFIPSHADASWSQTLYENGWYGTPETHYDFTKIEAFIVSDPAATQWEQLTPEDSSWTSTIVNPGYAVMTGPAMQGNLYFTSLFSGNNYPGLSWDLVVWEGDVIIGAGHITTGSGFTFTEYTVENGQILSLHADYDRSPVPLPSAAWLLGTGIVGFIGIRRRLPV